MATKSEPKPEEKIAEKPAELRNFYYPDINRVIKAADKAEADEKHKEIVKGAKQ